MREKEAQAGHSYLFATSPAAGSRRFNRMADAQSGLKQINRPAVVQKETKAPVTRVKAAIPLDYSVGGHGVDVNMEAPISTDDLIRAGGLGAGDGVGSAMPTAVDATDFEESLMDAAEYEDKEDVDSYPHSRPGLGASQLANNSLK